MNLLDYGIDLTPTSTVKTLASVGLAGDVYVRGIYPIPGESILVVTESGAFLYDKEFALINAVRITNLADSRLVPFNESSQDWSSEACSIPFYHMNVNNYGQYGHGFLVVRRTADLDVTEDRGDQGSAVVRTYRVWNIHFDPIDLSQPGPVVGQFHFQKSDEITADEFNLQEVTFLDGCSTSGFVADHGSGYYSDPATGRYDVRYAAVQSVATKWSGVNLAVIHEGDVLTKSRFWDSYAVFQVLIETRKQFFDWSTIDRSPSMGPPPEAVGCYLVFANASSRGPQDPPMKLVRMQYTSLQEAFSPNDAVAGAFGTSYRDGVEIARSVSQDKLPRGLPYLPSRVMAPGKILWTGNFLYSNLNPDLYGGVLDSVWDHSTDITARLNVHERWDEQIWVKWDSMYELPRAGGSHPWDEYDWPDTLQVWGLLGSEWGCQIDTPFADRRKDICGMISTKPAEEVPVGSTWIPGMMASIVIEKGSWASSSNQRVLINRGVNQWALQSVFRRYALRVGAIATPAQDDTSYFLPYISSAVAQAGVNDTSCRRPFVSFNPFRGWRTFRPLFYSDLAADASGVAREIHTVHTAMTPYTPAGLQVTALPSAPGSISGLVPFYGDAESYTDVDDGVLTVVTALAGACVAHSAAVAQGSGIAPLSGTCTASSTADAGPIVTPLIGTCTATSVVASGVATCTASLVGTSVGVSSTAGGMEGIASLVGQCDAVSSVADEVIYSPLLGSCAALSTADGILTATP